MKFSGLFVLQSAVFTSALYAAPVSVLTPTPAPTPGVEKRANMDAEAAVKNYNARRGAVGTYQIPLMTAYEDAPAHVSQSINQYNSGMSSAMVFGGNLQQYANMYNIIASSFNLHYAQSV